MADEEEPEPVDFTDVVHWIRARIKLPNFVDPAQHWTADTRTSGRVRGGLL